MEEDPALTANELAEFKKVLAEFQDTINAVYKKFGMCLSVDYGARVYSINGFHPVGIADENSDCEVKCEAYDDLEPYRDEGSIEDIRRILKIHCQNSGDLVE